MRTHDNFDQLRIKEDKSAPVRFSTPVTKKIMDLEYGDYFRTNDDGPILMRTYLWDGKLVACSNPEGCLVWCNAFTDVFPTGSKQLAMF